MLTQAELKFDLKYDQETGLFCWINVYGNKKAGWFAGAPTTNGYTQIRVRDVTQYAHRLAWLYMYGEFPKYIDHINRDKKDNRICNLRLASKSDNTCNSKVRADNSTGQRGVYFWATRNKWQAYVSKDGRRLRGLFDSFEEAAAWRESKVQELHGEFMFQRSSSGP